MHTGHIHHSLVAKSALTRIQYDTMTVTVLTGAGVDEQAGFLTHVKVGNIESTSHKTQMVMPAGNVQQAMMHHIAAAKMILANPAPAQWSAPLMQAYMPYKAAEILDKQGIQPDSSRFDSVYIKKMIENADLVARRAYGWLSDLVSVVCIAFMFVLVYWVSYQA